MQAIILAGGFGTRLRAVLPDLPKPMAPIGEKPFLAYLVTYLKSQGVSEIIFSVHYMHEKIQSYFQSAYQGINIQYAIEDEALGTGGAILQSLALAEPDKPVFVLNGDTFVQLDYQAMYKQHAQSNASMTMALRPVEDCARYGKVIVKNHEVISFKEKGEQGPGYINAGVYLIHPRLFERFTLTKHFSFEKDFLIPYLAFIRPQAFQTSDYFIDIGIPDDYTRAQNEFPRLALSYACE